MITVTVTTQAGCGGRSLARAIADALGVPCVDQQIIVDAAAALGVHPDVIAQAREPQPWWERVLGALAAQPGIGAMGQTVVFAPPLPVHEQVRMAIRDQIEHWAARGRCVIAGHGAAAAMRRHPRAVHLLAHAPRERRIEALCREDGVSPTEAAARIAADDARQEQWCWLAHRQHLLDVALYDLCLDMSRLSADAALRLAMQAITDREVNVLPRVLQATPSMAGSRVRA